MIYEPHSGTIRIAGATDPTRAAACAMHMFTTTPEICLELFCIGGNAQQQAVKTLVIFRWLLNRNFTDLDVLFVPRAVDTTTIGTVSQVECVKTATVWRFIVLPKSLLESVYVKLS